MSSDFIQKIKTEIGIDTYISKYVKLKRNGKRFLGLCPFHNEKTPSFNISPELKMYHCFGCGASGDIIKFVMDYDRVDFVRSLEILSEYSGIPLLKFEANSKLEKEKEELYSLNEKFLTYFRQNLKSDFGLIAKEYLAKRKIQETRIDIFKLGYSPSGFDNWKRLNLSDREVLLAIKLGLLKKSDKETVYDFYRDRIMFPIFDTNHKVVGFGGRLISNSDEAKYINSPASIIYDKGKMFFNLNLAQKSIRASREAILVEGYLDVIGLHSKEIENVIAPLGTAVTEKQIVKLKNYADKVKILFDGDSAGKKAALKTTEICIKENFESEIVLLENSQDPFDLSIQKTQFEILQILQNSIPASTFIINESLQDANPSSRPEIKKSALENLFEFIKSLKTETDKESYLREGSKKLGLSYESILKDFSSGKGNFQTSISDNKPETRKKISSGLVELERRIVSLLILNPDLKSKLNEILEINFEDPTSSTVIEWIREKVLNEDSYSLLDLQAAGMGEKILNDLAIALMDDSENNDSLSDKENLLESRLLQKKKKSLVLERKNFDILNDIEEFKKFTEKNNETNKIEQDFKLLN